MVEDGDEEEVEEVDPPKVLGDLLESLAGAIFLDSGMNLETVWRVFQPLFQSKIGMPPTPVWFNNHFMHPVMEHKIHSETIS